MEREILMGLDFYDNEHLWTNPSDVLDVADILYWVRRQSVLKLFAKSFACVTTTWAKLLVLIHEVRGTILYF